MFNINLLLSAEEIVLLNDVLKNSSKLSALKTKISSFIIRCLEESNANSNKNISKFLEKEEEKINKLSKDLNKDSSNVNQ